MTTAAWLDPMTLAVAAAAAAAAAWVAVRVVTRWRRGAPVVAWRPHDAVPWGGVEVVTVLCGYLVLASVGQELACRAASLVRQLAVHSAALAAAVGFGVAVLRTRGASWEALGLHGRWPADAGLAAAALGLMVAPLLALAGLLDQLVPYRHPLVDLLAERRDPVALAVVVGSAVVAAPVAEEFFFRRVLQGWLERRLPDAGTAAVVCSAAAFALAHQGQGLAYVPLFPFGVVLGVIARQTGSIVACIVVHALFNAVSVGILLLTT